MEDRIQTYRDNLRHCARPETSAERQFADSRAVMDYDALALRRALEEYRDYTAYGDEDREDLAQSYIEYIEMCIYDEEKTTVVIYAHTDTARQLLNEAVELGGAKHVSLPMWETK